MRANAPDTMGVGALNVGGRVRSDNVYKPARVPIQDRVQDWRHKLTWKGTCAVARGQS